MVNMTKSRSSFSWAAVFHTVKGLVKIDGDGTVEIVGDLSSEEMAVAATITQCLVCLRNGRLVDFKIDPNSFTLADEIVKCQWMPSGNLLHRGKADKHYQYATTAEEAMSRRGVFTCQEKLYLLLPKKRELTASYREKNDPILFSIYFSK